MTQIQDEYDRLRRRARELGKKGLDIDQVCERINAMRVYCDAPDRYTVTRWMKLDEKPRKPRKHGGGSPKRPVATSDGRVFDSVTKAARSIGVSASGLRSSMQRGTPCRGVRFRYKED